MNHQNGNRLKNTTLDKGLQSESRENKYGNSFREEDVLN
jgi:hypothetical protein